MCQSNSIFCMPNNRSTHTHTPTLTGEVGNCEVCVWGCMCSAAERRFVLVKRIIQSKDCLPLSASSLSLCLSLFLWRGLREPGDKEENQPWEAHLDTLFEHPPPPICATFTLQSSPPPPFCSATFLPSFLSSLSFFSLAKPILCKPAGEETRGLSASKSSRTQ